MRAVALLVITLAVSAMGGCFLEISENKIITGILAIYSKENLYKLAGKGVLYVFPSQYQVNLTKINEGWKVTVDGVEFIARKIYTNGNGRFIVITNETSDIRDVIDVLCVQSPGPDTNETLWQRFLMFFAIMLTSALALVVVILRRRRGSGADIEEISV